MNLWLVSRKALSASPSWVSHVALGLLVALLTVHQSSAAKPNTQEKVSHCTADEAVIFSCAVSAKVVSVCESRNATAQPRLGYRFGPPSKPEAVLSATDLGGQDKVTGGSLMFAAGGGAYLRFKRPPFAYVVYTAVSGKWGEKAGVAVERDGKLLRNLPCTAPETSQLGPAFFQAAQIQEDPDGFDLP